MFDYKPKNNQSNVYLKGDTPDIKRKEPVHVMEREFPEIHLMEIVNEKEEHLYEHMGASGGPNNQFGLGLPRDFINQSNKLHITVENLLYEVILDETIHIEVP
jgi:hypothetical protein